jgi:hypothetical protein
LLNNDAVIMNGIADRVVAVRTGLSNGVPIASGKSVRKGSVADPTTASPTAWLDAVGSM